MTHTVSARRRRTRRRGSRRPTFALRGFPPLRVDDSRHAELRNLRNGRLGRDHADALTRDQLLECVDAPKAERSSVFRRTSATASSGWRGLL